MRVRFFRVYEYVFPLVMFPLAYWLWLGRYDSNHSLACFAISMPVLFAYIVPALGTNWLHLWEFNSSLRLGRFRPQHGFLMGTATSLFALICLQYPPLSFNLLELLRSAFVLGSVLAFWNWLYDVVAIRTGYILVYNRPYHEQRGAEAVATHYCPIFFGTFGACYGLAIRVFEFQVSQGASTWHLVMLYLVSLLLILTVPVLAFVLQSVVLHGESGLQTYYRESNE